ncbi:MAG: hypothetical protein ACKN86_07735, partial [Crocinitomicaceae bacterium]
SIRVAFSSHNFINPPKKKGFVKMIKVATAIHFIRFFQNGDEREKDSISKVRIQINGLNRKSKIFDNTKNIFKTT